MKKIKALAVLLSVLCLCTTVTSFQVGAVKKTIDIYLIAGQSNAAGCTVTNEKSLYALDSRYIDGFDYIFYAGSAAQPGEKPYELNIQKVKSGCGVDAKHIGPELGMAETLSEYYNCNTGAYAGFIKYAEGGTSLLSYTGKSWASPSYKKTLPAQQSPDTGYHYKEFLDEVSQRMKEYKQAGYEPVIKAMYWMQGENDRQSPGEYIEAFKSLAADVRNDLTKLSGQNLLNMPIMIGEISRTFESNSSADAELNRAFIAAQRKIPNKVANCYIIPNSTLDINNSEGIVGSDNAHWNYKDCLIIGNMVGQCIGDLFFSSGHKHVFDRKVEDDRYLKSTGTCTKNAVYYKSCACGVKSNSETFEGGTSHSYGKWVVTHEPTATEKGTKERVCKKCGDVQIAKIAKLTESLKHKHIFNQETADSKYLKTDGTCTKAAVYYKSCSCGEKSDTETFSGSKAAHSFGETVVIKEATKTEKGIQQRTCTICNYVETTEIPMIQQVESDKQEEKHQKNEPPWLLILIIGVAFIAASAVIGGIRFICFKNKKISNV